MIRFGNPITEELFRENLRLKEIDSFVYINGNSNWKFSLHSHEHFCEMIYIVQGKGDYVVDHQPYQVEAGDLVLVNQGVPHMQISRKEAPLCLWNLSVQLRSTPELGENQLIPEGYRPVLSCGEFQTEMEECCRNLFAEMKQKENGYQAMCFLWVERYLWLVRRLLERAEKQVVDRAYTVEDVKQYIDSHFQDSITLRSLEERFHLSRFHIVHQMKKEFGITPIGYLIDRRMGAAQDLLNTTELSITEIALRVGYHNVNYFNKMFRKKIGKSPTEFRTSYINLH